MRSNAVYVSSSADTAISLLFLAAGKASLLPKYTGGEKEDFSEFVYKLQLWLKHPSIGSVHLKNATTPSNAIRSKHLASLLDLCVSGDVFVPFLNNPNFEEKGVEMYKYMHQSQFPQSQSTASNMLAAMSSVKIRHDETLEAVAKRLRDM